MAQYDGTLRFDTAIDDEGLQKGMDSLHDKAAEALGVLAGNLMTQATNALINLGQTALNAGTSLEAGMAKVSTLFTGTDEELGALTSEIRELSTASGLAADGLAEAAYSALSASVPAEQLGALLDRSTKLAAAGFTDVDTALSATAKTMNAYGQTGEEAMDKIQKVLIQTQNKGITTVGELGASLAQVTPTAASFGVAFEQVGAALSVMTAQGVPTAQATTMLNGIIAELGKSGTQAAENLEKAAEGSEYAGMSFTEMMHAGATLDEVLGLMSKYAEANGLAMVDMFSRIEAGKGALSIMANEGQTFRDDLAAMATDVDVVGEAYAKVSDTVAFKGEQIKTSFANIASGLYDLASEPLKDVQDMALGALSRIQEGLSEGGLEGIGGAILGMLNDAVTEIRQFDWTGAADAIIDQVDAFLDGDGYGELLRTITGIITSLGNGLAEAAPALIPAAEEMLQYLIRTTIARIPDFIRLGGNIIDSLVLGLSDAAPLIIERVSYAISELFEALLSSADIFLDFGMSIVQSLADGLISAGGTLAEIGPDLLDRLIASINDHLPSLANSVENIFTTVLSFLQEALPALFEVIVSSISAATPALLSAAEGLFGVLLDAANQAVRLTIEALPGLLGFISASLTEAAPLVLDAAVLLFRALVDAIPLVIELLVGALPELVTAAADLLVGATPLILDAATEMLHAVIDALPVVLDQLAEALPGLIDLVVTTLVTAGPRLLDAAIDFLMSIAEAIPELVSVLAERLPLIISSVLDALIDAAPRIFDAAERMLFQIVEAIPGIVTSLVSALPSIITAILKTLSDAGPKLLVAAKDMLGHIVQAIPDIAKRLYEAGKDIIAGLWRGIKESWGSLVDGFGDLVGGLVDTVTGLLGINSPSTVFDEEVGEWIPPGISRGVDRAMPAALDDMEQQADELVARMRGAIEGDLGNADIKLAAGVNATMPIAGVSVAAEAPKWVQVNNYYVPVASPSEGSRTQREALRNYLGGVQ